jgi:diguanylate cyclase (GGDEF)-like protein
MDLDSITTLPTRSELQSALEKLAAASGSLDSPTSLLLIDIDNFKAYNDVYGHDLGDALLKQVATAIRAECVVGQLLARVSGDEFAVILPNTDLNLAHDMAERIRVAISTIEQSPNCHKTTVSIGVATSIPHLRWNANDHLRLADLRLAVAKKRLNQPKDRVWSGRLPSGWQDSLGSLRWWPSSPDVPER